METNVKAPSAKRFVVEDSITKVTSDGEPHEMMTMIAGLSGLLAAVVILAILVSLVGCKKTRRTQQRKDGATEMRSTSRIESIDNCSESKRSSISTIYTRAASVNEGASDVDSESRSRLASVSIISNGNLEGNLNSAFVGSELSLSGSLRKNKKKTHWSADVERRARETTIDIERY